MNRTYCTAATRAFLEQYSRTTATCIGSNSATLATDFSSASPIGRPNAPARRAQIALVMARFQGRVYHQVFEQD